MPTQTIKLPWQARLLRNGLGGLSYVAPQLAGRMVLKLFLQPRRAAANKSSKFLQSAQRLQVEHKALRLQAYRWGVGPRKALLVHGWEHDARRWHALAPRLVALGYEVTAIDGPAHGASEGTTTSIPDFSAALAATVQQLGPFDLLIAHSFGAACSAWMLGMLGVPQPQRVVLMGAPTSGEYMTGAFADGFGLSQRLKRLFNQALQHEFGQPASYYAMKSMPTEHLPPALIVHDRDDLRVDFRYGQELQQHWPNSELLATSKLGHSGILHSTEVLDKIVTFVGGADHPR
ncbi:alpha/beta fold hydrolase [Herpetosiphon geysericola]|uniref:AB hydrolase-1 domain-containing protein n=1 Tax=Herpetosiphon geysericola TaxID=70996 RepID=A0A0P6Y3V0_9CHLR|nr:alpha/beta fold hydrolase [Herpetosiphon geysericola]KPL90638.1 hypothetical protein SE18_06115 [Herpetosiphon geysericola]